MYWKSVRKSRNELIHQERFIILLGGIFMESSKQLRPLGHVIRILDKFTLIIDVGKNRLSTGDKIEVYVPSDPIIGLNGDIIDTFTYVKDTLEVIRVQDNYSVCKKNKQITRSFQSFSALSSLSPMLEKSYLEQVPLEIDESEISPISPLEDTKIHVGDLVKLA